MTDCCGHIEDGREVDSKYRRILWIVLLINLVMFIVEISTGVYSGSQSLLADALDFFGDAANYTISLYVLSKATSVRAKASLIKGATMALFGLWVIGSTTYKALVTGLPQAEMMGAIGLLALIANVASAALLYRHRTGDSNRESVWICSRNDAIGNLAVILAAGGVFLTGTKWPDLLVAVLIAGLALSGAWRIIRHARKELKAEAEKKLC